jgi:hypothetical protein
MEPSRADGRNSSGGGAKMFFRRQRWMQPRLAARLYAGYPAGKGSLQALAAALADQSLERGQIVGEAGQAFGAFV